MKSIRELNKDSFNLLKRNGYFPFLIYFIVGILASGVLLLGAFSPLFTVILVPLVILPLFFASDTLILMLSDMPVVTASAFFRSFGLYFTERFRSTYGFWKAVLETLIVAAGFGFIYSMVINAVMFATNEAIRNMVNAFQSILEDPSEAAIESFMNSYSSEINFLAVINYAPIFGVASIAFSFFSSFHSLSYFYRTEPKNTASGAGSNMIHKLVYQNNRSYIIKSYFGLNWYVLLVFVLSLGLGAFLGYLLKFDLAYISAFSNATAVLITSIFLGPIFLFNKNAIYESLKEEYPKALQTLSQGFVDDLMNELNKLKKQEEETKKDSDES